MDFEKLYISAKESLSAFKENGAYHTHMFQYQAIGSAIGIAIGVFAEFFMPGAGKLAGMAATPIAIYSARKLGLNTWHTVVKKQLEKGNYIFALQEAKRLYESKRRIIQRSELSEDRKLIEIEKAFNEYLMREQELTRSFCPPPAMLNELPVPKSPIQQLIESNNSDNKISIVKSKKRTSKQVPKEQIIE